MDRVLATQEVERVRTKRGRTVVLAAVVATGLALVVSACGGGGGGGTNSSGSNTAGKTFPTLKVVWGTTDYMDPGLSYRLESWQLFQDVYMGLVVKAHVSCQTGNCAQILPGLATALPTTNNAGTDYKFTLRSGLKYSNGQPIKASDFKNTIARDFKLNSPGIGFFSNIVGIDKCEGNPTKCSASSITGIITNDSAGTIEIKLKKAESDFLYVLSIPFSSPVPSSTKQTDTENPPPAASGPYYISQYKPSRSFVMKRNPYWKKDELGSSVPNGNPTEIVGTMTDDLNRSAQLVQSGTDMYDENLLPTSRLAALKQNASQIKFYTTPSTYYWFLNEKFAPFNNLKARQAVNYATNRQSLVKLRGGLGLTTQNFLPPSYPQYKKINPYPYNLAKAKQLVQQSGTKGDHVDLWTIGDDQVDKAAGEYEQGVLKSLGYNVTIHEVAGANYFTLMGDQKTKPSIGFTDWFEDYPYPSDWFNILLNGELITPTHNNNYGNVNFPDVNKQIDKLDSLPPSQALSPATNAAWAKVDNELMTKYAATVPYLNGLLTSFLSSKMDMSCDVFTDSQDDLAQMCQK
jgi:peptide/nickel transport system substrate-binding protein